MVLDAHSAWEYIGDGKLLENEDGAAAGKSMLH